MLGRTPFPMSIAIPIFYINPMEGLGSEKAQDPLVPRSTCALQGRFASRVFLILTISHLFKILG
jgi:hypothetical protein